MSEDFVEQIQAGIRQELKRLQEQLQQQKLAVSATSMEIERVQRLCTHPNATRSEIPNVGYAWDCPDCEYHVLYAEIGNPLTQKRGRPSKKPSGS